MAVDFHEERKWKQSAANHLARHASQLALKFNSNAAEQPVVSPNDPAPTRDGSTAFNSVSTAELVPQHSTSSSDVSSSESDKNVLENYQDAAFTDDADFRLAPKEPLPPLAADAKLRPRDQQPIVETAIKIKKTLRRLSRTFIPAGPRFCLLPLQVQALRWLLDAYANDIPVVYAGMD